MGIGLLMMITMNKQQITTTQVEPTEDLETVEVAKVMPSAYTIIEAACVLRMSEKSVRRQIDRGNLRRCTKFGRVLIPRNDVDTFIEKNSAYAF